MNIKGLSARVVDAADIVVIDFDTHYKVVKNRIGPAPIDIAKSEYENLKALRWQNMQVLVAKAEDYEP